MITPNCQSDPLEISEKKYEFFTVAQYKFIFLCLGTCQLYLFYWFYQNWYFYKTVSNERVDVLKRSGGYPITGFYLFLHANRQIEKLGITEKINITKWWGLVAIGISSLEFSFPVNLLYFILPIVGILGAQKHLVVINRKNEYQPITSKKIGLIGWILILIGIPFLALTVFSLSTIK